MGGSETAVERYRALFQAEFAWMWTTLRRLGVKPSDLEDVAHEVFLQVYKKLEQLDPARPARPWLFAFAWRAASDYRRLARHRELPSEDAAETEAQGESAQTSLERHEDHVLLHQALDSLDLDKRAVVIAYELDGTAMKDIAEALGVPLNTAYSRLRLGREELNAAVRRLMSQRRGANLAKGAP